ncbi:MAG: hypothetical protein P4K83_02895 [Terracidiphilus sp.]|nr:hypothetical protein [Terracidiphilus sp.]
MKFKAAKVFSARQAADALIALFGQISYLRRQNIRIEFDPVAPNVDLLAHVRILDRQYMAVCALYAASTNQDLNTVLAHLRADAEKYGSNAIPVLIAPRLSAGEQQLCRNTSIGYLDLAGNARICLDEIFIASQTLPQGMLLRKPLAVAPLQASAEAVA